MHARTQRASVDLRRIPSERLFVRLLGAVALITALRARVDVRVLLIVRCDP